MISIGKQYMVFKPKEKTNNKGERIVSFSIGNSSYNKFADAWENKGFINVCAKTNQKIDDRDKVTISKITALDTSEYNDKQNVMIFVELEGEENAPETNYASMDDELPF
jgi:hypothetical protein